MAQQLGVPGPSAVLQPDLMLLTGVFLFTPTHGSGTCFVFPGPLVL